MQDRVPTKHPAASDEIDIREVFAAIGRFFKKIGDNIVLGILRLRQVSRKYAPLILSCILLGAAFGFLSYRSFEPYYASSLTINSRYYTAEMLQASIDELHQLAEEGNHTILARKLNITPEQAKQIRSFETKPVVSTEEVVQIESLIKAMEGNDAVTKAQLAEVRGKLMSGANNFRIIAKVYDIVILDHLEAGLIRYLKDNDYVKRRVAIEEETLLAMRDKLVREQERLDNLKTIQAQVMGKMIETSRAGSNNVILGANESANDPLNVYRQDLEFYREILKATSQLELNQSIETVSSFTPYDSPVSISLKDNLLLGAAIGMAIAYSMIMFLSINQALNRYEERHIARRSMAHY